MLVAAAVVRHGGLVIMKSKLSVALASAGCALCLSIGGVLLLTVSPAKAISFNPPSSTTVAFGNVQLGTTATLPFSYTWSHDGADGYSLFSLASSLTNFG